MPAKAKFRKLFRKRIIKPGTYAVPKYDEEGKVMHDEEGKIITVPTSVEEDRINHWVKTHQQMIDRGLSVPAPFRHDPKAVPLRLAADKDDTDAFKNGGFWRKLWKDKHGALWGNIEVRSKAAADAIENIEDVSLVAKAAWPDGNGNTYEDALTHIALVTYPVAKDDESGGFQEVEKEPESLDVAASFSFQDTLALSLSDLQLANDGGTLNTGMSEIHASSVTVKDVLEMLSALDPPIRLPDDTTSDNFLERIATALAAIQAVKEAGDEGDGSIREPNPKSKEQPGPVAMSQELTFALGLLQNAKVTNPATGLPFTQAEIAALAAKKTAPVVNLQMSVEDQAAVNLARKTLSKSYEKRIEALVQNGQVTPHYAKTQLAPLLPDLQFAFDGQGNQIDTPVDKILKACEALPKGSTLTGSSPTSARAQRGSIFGQQVFSLGGVVEEEDIDMGGDVLPMTDEDADALVDAQFRASGIPASRVEGGYAKTAR